MLLNIETGNQRTPGYDGQNVRGKAVVLVGGATTVGRATASLLVDRGARVFVTAHDPAELSAVLKEVCQWGNEVHGMVVDLSKPGEIRRIFEEAERRMGGIDILVNQLNDLAQQAGMNIEACQSLCMQEAIERMQARGKGHIINVGLPQTEPHQTGLSMAAKLIPVSGKGPVNGMNSALRRQAHELGIRVTLIETGKDSGRTPADNQQPLLAEDIARCVYESIVQPFRVDVVFLQGQVN